MKSVGVIAVACVLVAVRPARAQGLVTGAIEGRLVDARTGAPLRGRGVSVSLAARGLTATTTTDADGRYRITQLVPGDYVVRFVAGDAIVIRPRIRVDAGRTASASEALDPGAHGTVVDRRPAPGIDPVSSARMFVADRRYLTEIPVPGTTFEGAAGAAPGAENDGFGLGIAGASALENRYFVDGLDTTELRFGDAGTAVPDELIDAVGVVTGGAGPALGGATGGWISAITRHGTNRLHGGVYAAVAPAALVGATKRVASAPGAIEVTSRPGTSIDLAAELGGPLVKDRAWFYVAFAPRLARIGNARTIERRTDCHRVRPDGSLTGCDPAYADGAADTDPVTGLPVLEPVETETRTATANAYTLLGNVDVAPAPGHQGSLSILAIPTSARSPGTYGLASSGTRAWGLTTDASAHWASKLRGGALEIEAQLGWHRARHDTGALDPALDDRPAQVIRVRDLSTVGALGGESPAALRGCQDGGANDPYPGIVNCPLDTGYAIGGPGLLEHDLEDRRTASVVVTDRFHAAGLHELQVGLAGELDADARWQFYSGGATIDTSADAIAVTRAVQIAPLGTTDPAFDHVCTDPAGDFRCRYLGRTPPADPAARGRSASAFVRDVWRPGLGLVLDLGLRYDQQQLDSQRDVAGTTNPITGHVYGKTFLELPGLLEPRLGASWDPTGEGRAKLFAHWGRYGESLAADLQHRAADEATYYEQIFSPISGPGASPCGPVDPRLGVPDGTGCLHPSAPPVATVVGLDGSDALVAPGIRPGYLDELVTGAQLEVVPDLTVGVAFQDRRLGRTIEDVSADDATTYIYANPGEWSGDEDRALQREIAATSDPERRAQLAALLAKYRGIRRFDRPRHDHDALQLTIARRFSPRLYVAASYTYARTWGDYAGAVSYANGQRDPHASSQYDVIALLANRLGPLPEDRTHLFKLDAAYSLPLGRSTLVLGARLRGQSGVPELALAGHARYGPDEAYLLPSSALGRTPFTTDVDVHIGVRRRLAPGIRLEAFADVFDLFDDQGVFGVDNTYVPYFGTTGTQENANPISGGSYEDLIWAKAQDSSGRETADPVERNPRFHQPNAWYAPISARIGLRLTF